MLYATLTKDQTRERETVDSYNSLKNTIKYESYEIIYYLHKIKSRIFWQIWQNNQGKLRIFLAFAANTQNCYKNK